MATSTMILRLLAAALLGGIVGIERENKKRAAGLRTHVLVCVGSALVMITSECIFKQYQGLTNLDPARLGAQVISGIGFLGAGTIIKQGVNVRGLTTAASLWAVACIGLAVGTGYYLAAVVAVAVVFFALVFLGKLEKALSERAQDNPIVCVQLENKPGKLGEVASFIGKEGASITNIDINGEDAGNLIVNFTLKLPKGLTNDDIILHLQTMEGIRLIE